MVIAYLVARRHLAFGHEALILSALLFCFLRRQMGQPGLFGPSLSAMVYE
jgi:hypothetical protein